MPLDASIFNNIQQPPSVLSQLNGLQQVQSRGLEIQQQQQTVADMQSLDKAFQQPGGRDAVIASLPGHLRPKVQAQFDEMDKTHADAQEAIQKAQDLQADAFGRAAVMIREHGYNPLAAQGVISDLKLKNANNPAMLQQISQFEQGIQSNPTPDAIKASVDPFIKGSKTYSTLDTSASAAGARVTAANKPTESTLAVDAATVGTPQETPTAQQSAAALKLQQAKGGGTAEQDDQRYRNIQAALVQRQPVAAGDLAWARGYEKQKTLGPEASAAAAADRQAATIQQQTAQQARAQSFSEAQAGRKEYTEKVATPYQTALASAQTMRDTVAAAQNGNKVAANLQNLETAMTAIRAQGLNRINTTEIGVAANAGSLWDRIQGRIGALVAGKPVPADLQKDMLQFADILEKSATVKYQKGRTSLQQVYPEAKLPDESVTPGSAASPTTKVNPFRKP